MHCCSCVCAALMWIFLCLMCESQLHVVLLEVPLYRTLKRFSANRRPEEEEEASSQGDYTPKLHHSPLKALETFIINTLNIAEYIHKYSTRCVLFVMRFLRARSARAMHFDWTYFRHLGKYSMFIFF